MALSTHTHNTREQLVEQCRKTKQEWGNYQLTTNRNKNLKN